MKKVILIAAGFFFIQLSMSQTLTVEQYIEQHKDFAIREMKRMGVPAAITLAQGILETEFGNSDLVKKSNNHFGIKCKTTWTAAGVSHDDDAPGECFRIYKDAEGSYRDHSNFLRGNDRYSFLFRLNPADYKGWCYGLKKAGYATNPKYPIILIKNIEEYNLQQYTLEAVDKVPVFDASKYTNDPEEKLVYANDDEEKAFKELTKTTVNTRDKFHDLQRENTSVQFENKIFVNGAAAIMAKKGASLLAIAVENNINLSRLLEYNDLDKDGLLNNDQLIFLDKKSKEGETASYILQTGETVYDAAQKNGVRLQSVYEYNPYFNTNAPVAGAVIKLKPGANAAVDPSEAIQVNMGEKENAKEDSSGTVKMHAVQPKEGLYSISRKYGVTITQIKEWNNLPGDVLKVGQQLIISTSN